MPLGLQMTTIGSLGGDFMAMGGRTAVIDDKFWVGYSDKGGIACELRPVPVTNDFNDCWDLDGNDDYVPTASPVSDGWWKVDGSGDLVPIQNSCLT